MKRNIKITRLLVAGLITAAILSLATPFAFNSLSRPKLLPDGSGLPDRDIVFTINNGEIGFVNANGSGLVTRTVNQDVFGWPPGVYSIPRIGGPTTWSLDKRSVVGRYPTTTSQSGPPIFIQRNGEIHSCINEGEYLYGNDRVLFVSETEVLTVVLDKNYENKVVLIDIASCEVSSTLYQSPDKYGEGLTEANLSSQGWLAVSRWMRKETRSEIAVFSPNSSQSFIIKQADVPTWSPNGEWLAYSIYEDGLYIVRKTGEDSRKVVDFGVDRYLSSTHGWSPDGEWLVYTRSIPEGGGYIPAIFKVNLVSGQEEEIYRGGYNPDWR